MTLHGGDRKPGKWGRNRTARLDAARTGLLARGPHAYDPPLRDSVDLLLAVNAGYYSIEQANPRHEHEWRIWEDVKLPEGAQLASRELWGDAAAA